MKRGGVFLAVLALAGAAAAFLVSNSRVGASFVDEFIPDDRLPIDFLIDTEPVTGVANPVAVVQDLMNQWNLVPGARAVFGAASAGGAYNGSNVRQTFGVFTNLQREVAFDPTGDIFNEFGIGDGVLGITLKSVDRGSGRILDALVVINTSAAALRAIGSTATEEELFRATTLHELGHVTGLGHTAVGLATTGSFGLDLVSSDQVPTMYAFRVPRDPAEGGTLEIDDAVGLADVYPDGTGNFGAIAGRVVSASGIPINQLHVRAVTTELPARHVGSFTDRTGAGDGRFVIPGLEPGTYRVLIEAVNGRNNVDADAIGGGGTGLGSEPFLLAQDEYWTRGDTFDPDQDDPDTFATVFVRAGATTSVEFVLNGRPITAGEVVSDGLGPGDAQTPDAGGGFHFTDYYVFQGTQGDALAFQVTAGTFTPQLRLFGPGGFDVPLAEELPETGNAELQLSLPTTGVYTMVLSARATSGNPGGRGLYSVRILGSGGTLPATPQDTPAAARRGAGDPGRQEFASPLLSVAMLQAEFEAPGFEDLVVDRIQLRASGSGDDPVDLTAVRLVDDRDGDGTADPTEPVLAVRTFTNDNGTIVFSGLDWSVPAGETRRLLVTVNATVTSVSSAAQLGGTWIWLLALTGLAAGWRRPRSVGAFLVALVLVAPGCGGGGGGTVNGPFNPDGAIVEFQLTMDADSVEAFTPTTDPSTPITLPAAPIQSGLLRVSN